MSGIDPREASDCVRWTKATGRKVNPVDSAHLNDDDNSLCFALEAA